MALDLPCEWYRHGDLADAVHDYPALSTAPATATDGIVIPPSLRDADAVIANKSTAAGAHSFTIVLWGYRANTKVSIPAGITEITGSNGWDNLGSFLVTATGASLREGHELNYQTKYLRIAAQITSMVGAPTIWVDFGFSQASELSQEQS